MTPEQAPKLKFGTAIQYQGRKCWFVNYCDDCLICDGGEFITVMADEIELEK